MTRWLSLVWIVALLAAVSGCSGASDSGSAPGHGGVDGAAALAAAQPDSPVVAEGITVIGIGRVAGRPDVLRATVGVEVERPGVQAAIEAANQRAESVIAALRRAGVAGRDIQTRQVSVHPRHDERPDGAPVVRGYAMSNLVEARIRDIDRAGEILQVALEAGGDAARLQGVGFALEDNHELLAAARKRAFADAQGKARDYAELAGAQLGGIVSISEQVGGLPPPQPLEELARAGVAPAPVPLAPGEEEVAVHVTARWALR